MDNNRGSEKSRGKMKTRPNILQGEHSIISLIVELVVSSTLCMYSKPKFTETDNVFASLLATKQ